VKKFAFGLGVALLVLAGVLVGCHSSGLRPTFLPRVRGLSISASL
jgi:hypothetical protein